MAQLLLLVSGCVKKRLLAEMTPIVSSLMPSTITSDSWNTLPFPFFFLFRVHRTWLTHWIGGFAASSVTSQAEDLPVRLVHILHEKFRCSGNTRCLGFQSSVRFAFNSLREAPKTGEVWPFVLDLRIQLRLADEHQLTDEPGSCSFTGRLRRFCS